MRYARPDTTSILISKYRHLLALAPPRTQSDVKYPNRLIILTYFLMSRAIKVYAGSLTCHIALKI